MSEFLKTTPLPVYGQLNNKVDGTAITSDVSVNVVVDGGDYSNGAGTLSHKGGGLWEYLPTATESDSDSCVIHFTHVDAIPDRTVFYATSKRLRDLRDVSSGEVSAAVNLVLSSEHGAGPWGATSLEEGEVIVRAFSETAISQLAGQGITIVSPLLKDGVISIVQGDDYLHADGRSLNFISNVDDQWPDLTGATVIFQARQKAEFWQVNGVIVSTRGQQEIRIELHAADTDRTTGWWDYQLKLKLSNNHTLTIVQGRLQIIDELTS